MFAYENVDQPGDWRAFRHQIKRADGSICPGLALYTHPPKPDARLSVAVEDEGVRDAVTWLEKAFPRDAIGFRTPYQPTMTAVRTVLTALRQIEGG